VRQALGRLFGGRFWALALKELRQIRRDRRLAISLIVPPTLQILLFGFALDSTVKDLRLGVVDESRTAESRELISVLTQNPTFRLTGSYATTDTLGRELGIGRLDVGVVVPYDFARRRARGRPATVQVLLNAANANTAQIAKGYGADGVFIRAAEELGPALTAAIASGRPTVIQAPMENAPTPTPGHWDINCVYRKGS